uniref:Uncharacterized protein n=1 Tax=Anopheles darlingi TaxID=43151 RepID=A0A2M4DF62_ANODA
MRASIVPVPPAPVVITTVAAVTLPTGVPTALALSTVTAIVKDPARKEEAHLGPMKVARIRCAWSAWNEWSEWSEWNVVVVVVVARI